MDDAYLALVCVLPEVSTRYGGMPLHFSGALILVAVVLTLDLMSTAAEHAPSQ
jgi:preprotein translocase subunit SecY